MQIDPNKFLSDDSLVLEKRGVLSLLDGLGSALERKEIVEVFDKYVNLAVKYKYENYKLCTVSDILELNIMKSFSSYTREFLNESGVFLAIMNYLSGKPISAVFKKIGEKGFHDFSIYPCVYGLDFFPESFKYGDYVVITEGVYDSDSFRRIYPRTVAALTSSVSLFQAEILCSVTDKFFIGFDRDNAGDEGYIGSRKNLLKVNPNSVIKKLEVYIGDKDLGDLEREGMGEHEYGERFNYYKSVLEIMERGEYGW